MIPWMICPAEVLGSAVEDVHPPSASLLGVKNLTRLRSTPVLNVNCGGGKQGNGTHFRPTYDCFQNEWPFLKDGLVELQVSLVFAEFRGHAFATCVNMHL